MAQPTPLMVRRTRILGPAEEAVADLPRLGRLPGARRLRQRGGQDDLECAIFHAAKDVYGANLAA